MAEIRLKIYRSPKESHTETYRQTRVMVGREINNDIVVAEKEVSRFHCRLECDGEGWQISDLESTNGTFLNGIAVRQSRLKEGDVIVVGSVRLHVLECATVGKSEPLALGGYLLVQAFDARGMVGARGRSGESGEETGPSNMIRSDTKRTPSPFYPTVLAPVLTAAEILQGAQDRCALARIVGIRLSNVVEADACHVFLSEGENAALRPVFAEPLAADPGLVPAEILDHVRQSKTSVYAQLEQTGDAAAAGEKAQAVMCAPILDGDQMFGAMALLRLRAPWNFGDPDFETLSVAAMAAGAAMSCAFAYARLEKAYLDLLEKGEARTEREEGRKERTDNGQLTTDNYQ